MKTAYSTIQLVRVKVLSQEHTGKHLHHSCGFLLLETLVWHSTRPNLAQIWAK